MSNEENEIAEPADITLSIKKDWGDGFGSGRTLLFENPDDFDIYCDKERGVNYIFYGCELGCKIDFMEYDHETERITVHTKDHLRFDLGARIQWLVRPYIAKEQNIFVVRTKNGESIDGVEVHLRIKKPEDKKTLN